MVNFNGFNTAMIFDEFKDLLIIFNLEEILFFNKSAEEVLNVQSRNWRVNFSSNFVQDQLEVFFRTGQLPEKSFTNHPKNHGENSLIIEWRFEELSIKNGDRICLAIGSIRLEKKLDHQDAQDPVFLVKEGSKGTDKKPSLMATEDSVPGIKLHKSDQSNFILENSHAVLFVLDPNDAYKITFVTDNVRIFGFESTSILDNTSSMLEFFYPEDREDWGGLLHAKGNKDHPEKSGEFRILDAKGAVKWVDGKSRAIYGRDGKVIRIELLLQDKTERKNERLEIEENKRRYQALAANIPFTNVFLIDKDLNYILAEGPNFRYWGLDKSYFEGRNLREVHTTNLADIAPIVMQALRKKSAVSRELSYMNRVYDITAKPIMKGDEVEYIMGLARDISGEYLIRKELQKSELKYRSLVEESTEIIFSINEEMELTYISPNIKQFLGYETYEVISGGFTKFLHPEDSGAFSMMLDKEERIFEKKPYVEFRLQHKQGDFREFSAHGKVIKDEKGRFRYYTGIARDISKLKATKRELHEAKEKAEQALLAKSQFLSIMSHEIRTPMNAVIGLSHLLIEGNPREEQLENLKTLQFSAENLLGLINDILDFSKMDSGKIELENVRFDIGNLIHRIIHSYTYQLREKSLEVIVDLDPGLPKEVSGDPVRLGQIINNLMSNAIKFTNSGFVRISLEVMAQRKEDVTVRFVFEDTGIGIAEEKKKSIFEAFTQASTDTTRKYGGTGLGLAIVKKLMDLFGSEIEVISKKEGGSLFKFDIVFEQVNEKRLTSDGAYFGENKSLKHKKILVAEDNVVNQIMLKKFLEKWEVDQLEFANNGEEAIEFFIKMEFDLLLLDLQMPIKDGFEVARYIRGFSHEEKKAIPIIALTASSLMEVKNKLEEVGINDYISKPFIPDDLYGKLIKYLK